jgi:hypothetical protein
VSTRTDDVRGPRFSRIGDFDTIHYPTGFTMGRTKLAALAEALKIHRWHIDNARVVAAMDARNATE